MSLLKQFIEEKEKGLDEKFEWTDFSGNIGGYVLVKKGDGYATEENERGELKFFLSSTLKEFAALIQKEVKLLIEKHKNKACVTADSAEYDPSNMTMHIDNPLIRSLVYNQIDFVRELYDIIALLEEK
jgi:hypothetical protein